MFSLVFQRLDCDLVILCALVTNLWFE